MNAILGLWTPGYVDIIGPFCTGTTNDNLHLLLSLCSSTCLMTATGAWLQRPDIHLFTWISNDDHTKKELDHILVCPLSIIRSYQVYMEPKCLQEYHHQLITEIAIPFRLACRQRLLQQLNVKSLKDDPWQSTLVQCHLSNKFVLLESLPNDGEDAWTQIRNTIHAAAKDVAGYKKAHKQQWPSDDASDTLKAKAWLKGYRAEHKG